jgi:hypothetical protein
VSERPTDPAEFMGGDAAEEATRIIEPGPAEAQLERFLVVAVPPENSDLPTVVVEVEAVDASSAAHEVTDGEGPEGTVVYAAPWREVSSFIVLMRPRDEVRET